MDSRNGDKVGNIIAYIQALVKAVRHITKVGILDMDMVYACALRGFCGILV